MTPTQTKSTTLPDAVLADWMTTPMVMAYLGLSDPGVQHLIGKIESRMYDGRTRLFKRTDIEAYAAKPHGKGRPRGRRVE
jgi:excisionase family DNA binding protein